MVLTFILVILILGTIKIMKAKYIVLVVVVVVVVVILVVVVVVVVVVTYRMKPVYCS